MPTGQYDRTKSKGNRGQSQTIHNILLGQVGMEVTNTQLQELTGYSERQIMNAMSYLIRSNWMNCKILIRGKKWKVIGPGQGPVEARKSRTTIIHQQNPNRRLFEELATTRSGVILVESEDGEIYRLVEL
jgi:hypothetical protein